MAMLIRVLAVLAGMLVGAVAGYMAGAYIACDVFEAGNLCGLWGAFITGPLGLLGGGLAGWFLSRRGERPGGKVVASGPGRG